jgi:hypothetical protein
MTKYGRTSVFFGNIFGDSKASTPGVTLKKVDPSIMKSKYPSLGRHNLRADAQREAPMFSKTVFNPKTKFVGTVQGGFYRSSNSQMTKSNSNYRVRPSFSMPGVKLPFTKSKYNLVNDDDDDDYAIPNKKFDVDSLHDNYRKVNPLSGR